MAEAMDVVAVPAGVGASVVEVTELLDVGADVVLLMAVGASVMTPVVGGMVVVTSVSLLGAMLGLSDGIYMLQSKLSELDPKSTGQTKQGHVLGSFVVLLGVIKTLQLQPLLRRKSNCATPNSHKTVAFKST